MLYAKISPAAQVVKQDGPFNTTVVSANYMVASTTNYVMGETDLNLVVSYGAAVTNQDGVFLGCNFLTGEHVKLTKEEVSEWGTDDTYILNLIAEKKGLTILEIIDSSTITTTTTTTTIL